MAAPTGQMAPFAHAATSAHDGAAPAFDDVYTAHVGFVWRVLRTFGVSEIHVEDAVQDVFIVVHRRLGEWQGKAAITTWLFSIARRVAANHRRREKRTEPLREDAASGAIRGAADDAAAAAPTGDPFAEASRAQAAATVLAILEQIDDAKRSVFALVELEQLPVPEVARMLGINLNTAYSRLRLARQAFEVAVKAMVKP